MRCAANYCPLALSRGCFARALRTNAGVYIPILPNDERYTAILNALVPFMVGLPLDTGSTAQTVDLSADDGVFVVVALLPRLLRLLPGCAAALFFF